MTAPKLFMVLAGCRPAGRHTEQHDVFFGIGRDLKQLVPGLLQFWPEARGRLHIDAWREVTNVDGYAVAVVPRVPAVETLTANRIFFLNLGGYKPGEFEEFHYKMLTVSEGKGEAIKKARQSLFYKHTGFPGAVSHIDDKYGIDVDDIHEIEDILSPQLAESYRLELSPGTGLEEDRLHIGYVPLSRL